MFFGTTDWCLDNDRLYCETHMLSFSGSYGRLAGRLEVWKASRQKSCGVRFY